MSIDQTRQWITTKYNASAWYRLAFIAAALVVNLAFGSLIMRTGIESEWILGPLLILSMITLAVVASWLVTWYPPYVYASIDNSDPEGSVNG